MALISGAGVPAGAVFDSMELTNEPSFYERGICRPCSTATEDADDNLAGPL